MADIVIGHTAGLVAHTLRRVDRLVDDAVAGAATLAREAESFLEVTLTRWSELARQDEHRDAAS